MAPRARSHLPATPCPQATHYSTNRAQAHRRQVTPNSKWGASIAHHVSVWEKAPIGNTESSKEHYIQTWGWLLGFSLKCLWLTEQGSPQETTPSRALSWALDTRSAKTGSVPLQRGSEWPCHHRSRGRGEEADTGHPGHVSQIWAFWWFFLSWASALIHLDLTKAALSLCVVH